MDRERTPAAHAARHGRRHTPLPSILRPLAALALIGALAAGCDEGSPTDGDDDGTTDAAPDVAITSPADGATFIEGDEVSLEGAATDVEDGELTGSALVWSSDRDGTLGTGASLGTTLTVGQHAIMLKATDSGGNADSASLTLTVVENQAPSVTIDAPADGSSHVEGDTLVFEGSASDPEDGTLPDSVLSWSSSVDGALGSGPTVTTAELSQGGHVIRLTVTDRHGEESADSIGITVEAPASEPLVWAATTAGGVHSCGVTTDGQAYCWGYATRGTLGDGQTDSTTAPVRVSGDLEWSTLTAGLMHTCGLTASGQAYCWGSGSSGQGGNGSTSDQAEPVQVAGAHTWADLDAGANHTCGVTADSVGYCWGSDIYHELGDSTHSFEQTEPVRIGGDHTWAMVSAGGGFSCGVAGDGTGYCWGTGNSGRLGYGGYDDQPEPVQVAGNHAWRAIHAGAVSTCGITTDGEAYCWGQGSQGAMGNGSTSGEWPEPVLVSGGHAWTDLYVGGIPNIDGNMAGHVCGIVESGEAYCWGDGDDGETGSGFHDLSTPTAVTGGSSWIDIAAGNAHSCGVTADNVAMCWGRNSVGQVGDGTNTDRSEPTGVVDP